MVVLYVFITQGYYHCIAQIFHIEHPADIIICV